MQEGYTYMKSGDLVPPPPVVEKKEEPARPITPDELKTLLPESIRGLNYYIHKKHDVINGYSLISWKRIERSARFKLSNKTGPFDPSYFEYIRRTYEGTGHYVVTHEFNEEKKKDYVRFQLKDHCIMDKK